MRLLPVWRRRDGLFTHCRLEVVCDVCHQAVGDARFALLVFAGPDLSELTVCHDAGCLQQLCAPPLRIHDGHRRAAAPRRRYVRLSELRFGEELCVQAIAGWRMRQRAS
jgi:hypothetical protein